MSIFPERIKEERKKRKLTQEDMAEKLNITRPAYTMYETGKSQPSLETAVKIADIFQVSLDYLVGRYN
jgi:transcriptional regulator with XRE-family HTH domain